MEKPLEPYLTYWRHRREKTRRRRQRLILEAWHTLERLKKTLVERFGVREIMVFGSLAKGGFRVRSDLDVAVSGIPRGDFFQAWAAVNGKNLAFTVDLKPWEDLDDHFRKRILATGIVIYAREDSV